MRSFLSPILLCALIAAAGTAGAQEKKAYRWKDEKGRIHYSDVPAPRSEKIDIQRNGKVDAMSADAVAAEARGRECQRRRDQLASYTRAGDITETDALGNSRSYTDAEKKTLIARIEAQVKEYCDDANPITNSSSNGNAGKPPQ